jgi:hypothetical protein
MPVGLQKSGFKRIFANFFLGFVVGIGLDSLTNESILLAPPQKSPKESIPPDSIPGFVSTLLFVIH